MTPKKFATWIIANIGMLPLTLSEKSNNRFIRILGAVINVPYMFVGLPMAFIPLMACVIWETLKQRKIITILPLIHLLLGYGELLF